MIVQMVLGEATAKAVHGALVRESARLRDVIDRAALSRDALGGAWLMNNAIADLREIDLAIEKLHGDAVEPRGSRRGGDDVELGVREDQLRGSDGGRARAGRVRAVPRRGLAAPRAAVAAEHGGQADAIREIAVTPPFCRNRRATSTTLYVFVVGVEIR